MWQQIRRFFTAPTSEVLAGGEEEIQRASLLHSLVSIHAAFLAALIFISFVTPAPLVALSAVGSLLLADVFVLFLNRRGQVSLAAGLFTTALWLVIVILTVFLGGIYGVAFSAYLVVVAVAAFLLGLRETAIFAVLTILASLALAWAQENNYLPAPLGESSPIFMWLSLSVYVLMLAGIARLATRGLYAALARVQQSEQSLASSYSELEESRDALDAQTHALEQRTAQLRAASEVSRILVSLLDIEDLLWQAADLLSERFDLYHVGVFQLDSAGRWAKYRAGAGEAGRLLVEQQFRLEVGGNSMVGWCTANAQARMLQDVSTEDMAVEPLRVHHPLVPQTRSEAALPLIARGRVIGALSLQSDRPGTFDPDTVDILQTIADQIAIAMDNVQLLASSQEALEAARRAYGESTRQAWAELLHTRGDWGYRYEDADITPLKGDWQVEAPEDTAVVEVEIPLKIRDKVIGVLSFQKEADVPESQGPRPEGTRVRPEGTRVRPEGTRERDMAPEARAPGASWTADETRFLERLAEQMGLALESARLYQDTQRRAAREQTIRQVTERMRRAVDVEAILQSTVVELARAMGAPRAYVRLGTGVGPRSGTAEPSDGALGDDADGDGRPQDGKAFDIGEIENA
jgi:GAF domain-containing protein